MLGPDLILSEGVDEQVVSASFFVGGTATSALLRAFSLAARVVDVEVMRMFSGWSLVALTRNSGAGHFSVFLRTDAATLLQNSAMVFADVSEMPHGETRPKSQNALYVIGMYAASAFSYSRATS